MSKEPYFFQADRVGIGMKPEGHLSREQSLVLRFLTEKIYRELSQELNYDHLSLTIPRMPLPLKVNGKRYDLAFMLGKRLILIDVCTVKLEESRPHKVSVHG